MSQNGRRWVTVNARWSQTLADVYSDPLVEPQTQTESLMMSKRPVSSLSLRVQQTSALHRDRLGLFGQGEVLSIVAQPRFGIGIDQVAERPTLAWKRWFSDQTTRYSLGRFRAHGPKRCRCGVRCCQNPTTAPEALTLPGLQQRSSEIAGYSDCR